MGYKAVAISSLAGREMQGPYGVVGYFGDVLLEPDLTAIRYFAVGASPEVDPAAKLVPASAVSADADAPNLCVTLTPTEIDRLPTLAEADSLARAQEHALYDSLHWQPYWSPDESPTEPNLKTLARVRRLDCVNRDGSACRISDVLADPSDWLVTSLYLTTASRPRRKLGMVPPSQLAEVDWPAGCARIVGHSGGSARNS